MYCTMLFIIVVMELVIIGSSLRIEPFRFLKENSVYVYQQSKYIADRIALKLTVFAFVFCIYAVTIYRAMNSKVAFVTGINLETLRQLATANFHSAYFNFLTPNIRFSWIKKHFIEENKSS